MALNSNFRTLTADNIEGVVSTRNYLRNSFENRTLDGWTELNVALTNGLPTGTPTISATAATSLGLQTTNTPLSLDRSLVVQVPSALVAGDGFISDAFTIDRMDAGKVLTISFDYEMVEGTYNFSGALGSQTWMVYVYNDTAGGANWIQPAGFLGMNQSSGPGRVTCTFQSSVVWGQKYRVAVIASQAASGMSSINFDNFTCSRQVNPIGQLRNPAGTIIATGSLTPPNGYLYCNGALLNRTDYAELFAAIGTSYNIGGETGAQFRLPDLRGIFARGAGTNPNNANNTTTIGARQLDAFGSHDHGGTIGGGTHTHNYTVRDGGGASQKGLVSGNASWPNPNIRNLAEFDTGGHSHTIPASGGTETRPANVGVAYHICFSSGSVQLSSDTDTRVVAAGFYTTTNKAVSSGAAFSFDAISYDTHSAVTLSQGRFTAPVSGIYQAIVNSASRTVSGGNTVKLYKNGAVYTDYFAFQSGSTRHCGSASLFLNAGEYIDFRIDGAITLESGFNITVNRLSGPSVIAATENVIAKYSTTAGQAITSTPATVVYATREIDSHGIVNTINGDITIPISGKYLIGVYGSTASATWASGQQFLWQIRKNGSFSSFINQIRAQAAYTGILESVGPTYIDCLAGDVINIQAQSSVATTLRTAAGTNFFYLVRLGN